MGIGTSILLIILAILAVIILMAWQKPDVFRVERRARINAPADIVFNQINDLRAWEAWSPWQKKDPAMKQTYSGPDTGVGATQAWEGNSQVGKGQMTIIASESVSKVDLLLAFEKPFKARNTVELTLKPDSEGTEVIWAMHGPANLMAKVMDLLMNMDRMCGRDFEAGLANLKTICEKAKA
jgi:Polyketide cyclase / dehydrase and lipid transport